MKLPNLPCKLRELENREAALPVGWLLTFQGGDKYLIGNVNPDGGTCSCCYGLPDDELVVDIQILLPTRGGENG